MKYQDPKVVRSRPGLSQEQALLSLQNHPEYKVGTQIKSMVRQANRWVATILEPKEAVFPPKAPDEEKSDEEESPLAEAIEDSADDSDDSDSEDKEKKGPELDLKSDEKDDEGEPKAEAKGELGEVLQLLHEIIDGLGISPPGVEKGLGAGPEAPVGPKPGPPPPGGPGAGPGAGGPPPPGPGGAKGAPGKMRPLRDVPPGANPISGFSSTQRVASFTATADDDGTMTIKQAKAELETAYPPYKVKQLRRSNGQLHALLSIR